MKKFNICEVCMKKFVSSILVCMCLAICGVMLVACGGGQSSVQSHTEHEWGEWEVREQPSCGRYGIKIRYCQISGCGEFEEQKIEMIDHSWVLENTENYGCENPTYYYYRCENCGETKREESKSSGHNFVLQSEKPATCQEVGYKSYICEKCGASYDEVISQLDHNYEYKSHILATCREYSYDLYECTMCKARIRENIGNSYDKNNHNYNQGEPFEAQCEQAGGTCYRCIDCWYDYVEYDYENQPALGHNYKIEHIDATCTSCGRNYNHCTRCGSGYYDNLTDEPAIPHTYSWETQSLPTCTSTGTKYGVCQVCGASTYEDIEKLAHNYDDYGLCGNCNTSYYYIDTWYSSIYGLNTEVAKTLEIAKLPTTYVKDSTTYQITKISSYSFQNNAKIKKLIIPEGITTIGTSAFSNMTALEEVIIPSTVTQIDYYAFSGCTNLTTVYFNTNNFAAADKIMVNIFEGCSKLKYIIFGSNVTAVPNSIYCGTAVESLELPDTIVAINPSAMRGVTSLKSITAQNVSNVGAYAFAECTSLQSVTLPNVTSIDNDAFSGCTSLASISFPKVELVDDRAFENCGELNLNIPTSVTRIGTSAFEGCCKITNITLPESLQYIGSDAFSGCGTIEEFNALDNIEELYPVFKVTDIVKQANVSTSNVQLLAKGQKTKKLTFTSGEVNEQTFERTYSYMSYDIETLELSEGVGLVRVYNILLSKIILPKSVTVIPENAFSWTQIRELECKGNITTIGKNAFFYANMKDWYVPTSLTTVEGNLGFNGNSSTETLQNIYISDLSAWLNIDFQNNSCPITSNTKVYVNEELISELVIPENVTKVKNIQNWSNLTKLTMHKNVELSSLCLSGLNNLAELTVPNSTKFRELFAINGYVTNSTLKKVTVLSGDIESSCFSGFRELEHIVLPDDCKVINSSAFNGTKLSKLTTLSSPDAEFALPESLTKIGKDVFNKNTYQGIQLDKVVVTDLAKFANIEFENVYSNPAYTAKEIDMPTTLNVGKNQKVSPYALVRIENLDTISVDGGNTSVTYDENGLVTTYNSKKYLVRINKSSENQPNLSGINYIAPYAFCGYTLKSINFNVSSLEEICEGALYNCSNLVGISLPFINKPNAKTSEDYLVHKMFGKQSFQGATKITCSVGDYTKEQVDYYVPSTLQNIVISGDKVGNKAFYNIDSLKSISFVNVTSISGGAMEGVSHLSSIYLNYETMSDYDAGGSPFARTKFTGNNVEVTFGSNVTYVPKYMFYENTSITKLNLKNSKCTKIGYGAFKDCPIYQLYLPTSYSVTFEQINNSKLNLTIPNENIIEIGSYKEDQTNLDYLKQYAVNWYDYNKYQIGGYTFESIIKTTENGFVYAQTALGATKELSKIIAYVGEGDEVALPESLNDREYTFSSGLFAGSKVKKVTLPSSLTEIPSGMFYNSTIETIEFGSSVKKIGAEAFTGCNNLMNVIYKGTIADWCNISFMCYGDRNIFTCNPLSCAENFIVDGSRVCDLIIPEGVKNIYSYAFYGYSFDSVTLPGTLKSIGSYAFSKLGRFNFTGTLADWCQISFDYNPLTLTKQLVINNEIVTDLVIEGTEIISKNAFKGANFDSITIKSDVKNISESAFENVSAKTLTLQDGLEKIYTKAFMLAIFENTRQLDLPSTLTYIGESAFCGTLLDEVEFNEGLLEIGDSAFGGTNLTNIVLPNSLTTIGSWAFSGLNLTSVEFGNSLKQVGSYAFRGTKISSLVLPASIEEIGYNAFANIKTLENVTINSKTVSFGSGAFDGDDSIMMVNFDGTASEWAVNIFYNEKANPLYYAKKLYLNNELATNIVIENVKSINSYAFVNTQLESVELKSGLETICDNAFLNATSLTQIIIPEGATSVGTRAFEGILTLTKAILPTTLTQMGQNIFAGCTSLTELTIPFFGTTLNDKTIASIANTSSLKIVTITNACKVPNNAFKDISTLTTVNLPNVVTSIGSFAFSGCDNLKQLELSSSLTTIDYYAFGDFDLQDTTKRFDVLNYTGTISDFCALKSYVRLFASTSKFLFGGQELLDLTITSDITSISDYLFSYSTFNSVSIDTKETGKGTFEHSTINNLTFGNNVKKVNEYFAEYANVANVTLNAGLEYIGREAFYKNTGLTNVYIPDSVQQIDLYAFGGCTKLIYVDLPMIIENKITPKDLLGNFDDTMLDDIGLQVNVRGGTYISGFNGTHIQKVTCGSTITSVEEGAFYDCEYLSEVKLSDNISIVGKKAFYNCGSLREIQLSDNISQIGDYAFYGCKALTQITIPNNADLITYNSSNGDNQNFGEYVFENAGLTQVTLPDDMTFIPGYAFKNCNLTSITFPSKLYRINWYALAGNNFTEMIIPETITWLDSGAFDGCENLTKFQIPGTIQNLYYTSSSSEAKSGFFLSSVFDSMPKNLKVIDIYGTKVTSYFFGSKELSQVDINVMEGVKTIDEYAFYEAKMIKNVTLPSTLELIGNFAFAKSSLAQTTIPRSISQISVATFMECSNLQTVIFEDLQQSDEYDSKLLSLVSVIGDKAFYGSSIQTIKLPSQLKTIGTSAFNSCSQLTEVSFISQGMLNTIGKSAFANCTNLETVNILSNIKVIDDYTFSGCEKLTEVNLSSSLESIGICAFQNTKALKQILIDALPTIDKQAFLGSGIYQFYSTKISNQKEYYEKYKPYASSTDTTQVTTLEFLDNQNTYFPSVQFADYLTGKKDTDEYKYSSYLYKYVE